MQNTLKFIFELLKPHKKAVLLASALAIFAAALDTLGPVLMGRGFDLAGADENVAVFGGALFLWFATRWAADWLRSYVSYRGSIISDGAATRFVSEKFGELLDYPLSFHYGSAGRDSREKISSIRWGISNLLSNVVFDFVPAILTAAAISAYLFILDPIIGATLSTSVAVLVLYIAKRTPEMRRRLHDWHLAADKLHTSGWDACQNILTVKSTGNEGRIREQLSGICASFEEQTLGYEGFLRQFRDRQNIIVLAGSTGIVFLALLRFSAGDFTFGQLSAVTAYAFSIFGYVRGAQWGFIQVIKVGSAREALEELTAAEKEDMESGTEHELTGDVEFRNVRFRYRDDRPILEDVSFGAKAGSHMAVIGESGEGKTTLVDLLGRYYAPSAGTIIFDGVDMKDINLRSLRSQMAYVPQDLTLFHDTIEANIRFGRPDAPDGELKEAARLAHLEDFIESLPEGWKTIVGERGLKLSGGERQRVALARAFLRDPKILILDEPTSNLDSKTEAFIQDSLNRLMRGRTTFIIAHRLKTIMHADRILVLKDGRIAESGTHDELLKRHGAYADLLRAQSDRLAS